MKAKVILLFCYLLCFTLPLTAQPTSFEPIGIGGGGALFFPTINPANSDEYYVSCDMSQLFHTTDFGDSYSQVHFSKLQVFNNSTYEFTNNASIAYCNFNDGNEGYPVKTTDGGNTWQQLTAYDLNNYGSVYKMSAHYDDPDQLLIAAYGDILFSDDGGGSFSLAAHAADMGVGLIMGGVLWDGSNIYIGTNEGILHSSNGGGSFAFMATSGIPAGQVIWSFAGAKSGNSLRFACITADENDTYNGIMPWDYYGLAQGVYVMDDASGTWTSSSTGINFADDFVMYVAMHQNDIGIIYLGGNDNALSAPLVYKSTSGGTAWSKVFNTTNNANVQTGWEGYQGDKNWSWSETCFGITAARNNSNKVIFSSYSNVHVSDDGGANWKQAYVSENDQHAMGLPTPKNQVYHSIGLENTTCWQVYWQSASNMIGCFSDIGGIRSTDSGDSWGYTYSGFSVNSLYRMAADSSGNLYGACSGVHDIYQSTRLTDSYLDGNDFSGKIVYSTDNGSTWANLHVFNHPVFWLAADPTDANHMYASVIHYGGTQGAQQGGIYVCEDLQNGAASTWTKLSNPPRTEGHPASIVVLDDGKVLCTFSGRRTSNGFTASSGVFLYDPSGGGSWSDLSDPGMHYWTKDVVVDPSDPTQNTWFVAVFSGWGGAPNGLGGLYKTTNRGSSWAKLTGSQFDRATSITFNPQNDDQVYLSTETQGLWISNDIHAATPTWSLVSSYPFRQPERIFFNPHDPTELWVTSFGNGMKRGSLGATGGIADFSEASLVMYPNPSKGDFNLQLPRGLQGAFELRVYDLHGRLLLQQVGSTWTENALLRVALGEAAKGIYWVQLRCAEEQWQGKLLLD